MINIEKKSDITIPFTHIGESEWETRVRTILVSFAENWGGTLPEVKTESEIKSLEQRLGTELPAGLTLFYQTFGIADIGEQLQSFDEMGWLKDIWGAMPEYGPDFSEQDDTVLPFLVTFSDYLGNGNMFCFHRETKEIYYFDHDSKPYLTRMFGCVDDYLKGCLIACQAQLFADLSLEKEANRWAEEILEGLYGSEIVRKWYY